MKLRIGHLYPNQMNLYGDKGNIIALRKRAQWHGLEAEVVSLCEGETFLATDFDLLFFGGGQDREQKIIAEDLVQIKKNSFYDAITAGVVVLAVCGGYQLLGESFKISDRETLPGIGVFDTWTVAGSKRLIGNVVIQTEFFPETLVGFENHSGQTFLKPSAKALGKIIAGHGNNGEDNQEGCFTQNAFGTYLHGSLLPKNPHFTDYLLKLALQRQKNDWEWQPIENELENSAHTIAEKIAKHSK
jgi:hypothetical protein